MEVGLVVPKGFIALTRKKPIEMILNDEIMKIKSEIVQFELIYQIQKETFNKHPFYDNYEEEKSILSTYMLFCIFSISTNKHHFYNAAFVRRWCLLEGDVYSSLHV